MTIFKIKTEMEFSSGNFKVKRIVGMLYENETLKLKVESEDFEKLVKIFYLTIFALFSAYVYLKLEWATKLCIQFLK